MDKHWSNFCTMSIVHFMAYPQCLKGEGPIAATVAKIAPAAAARRVDRRRSPADCDDPSMTR